MQRWSQRQVWVCKHCNAIDLIDPGLEKRGKEDDFKRVILCRIATKILLIFSRRLKIVPAVWFDIFAWVIYPALTNLFAKATTAPSSSSLKSSWDLCPQRYLFVSYWQLSRNWANQHTQVHASRRFPSGILWVWVGIMFLTVETNRWNKKIVSSCFIYLSQR